jgi:hypothetical protein
MATLHESDVLRRVIESDGPMSHAEATAVMRWSLPSADEARVRALNERAELGELGVGEREELEAYLRVGHVLARLRVKALATLNAQAPAGAAG